MTVTQKMIPEAGERVEVRHTRGGLAGVAVSVRAEGQNVGGGDCAFLVEELTVVLEECEPLAPGWQPIETAPKDGAPILAYEPRWQTSLILRWGRYSQTFEDDEGNPCDPTHWMPLPEPPKETP